MLCEPDSARPVLVVVIDEMDFLLSGKNTVLYNLLEWQTLKHAKMVMVGIANTMDLPERLAPKLRSRFGVHRIAFRSYSSAQLESIIFQRLEALQVFDDDAVRIYAKMLAHQSGDVRKALGICKKAAEIARQRASSEASPAQELLVTTGDFEHAFATLSVPAHMVRLRQCGKYERVFLAALHQRSRGHSGKSINFQDVVDRVAFLCRLHSIVPVPKLRGLLQVAQQLERSRLLRVNAGSGQRHPSLELSVTKEELVEAFSSDTSIRGLL